MLPRSSFNNAAALVRGLARDSGRRWVAAPTTSAGRPYVSRSALAGGPHSSRTFFSTSTSISPATAFRGGGGGRSGSYHALLATAGTAAVGLAAAVAVLTHHEVSDFGQGHEHLVLAIAASSAYGVPSSLPLFTASLVLIICMNQRPSINEDPGSQSQRGPRCGVFLAARPLGG
jgi:hypothetical protein